jgi:hypothetical protein
MNSNYLKLTKMKDDKVTEIESEMKKMAIKLK